MKSITIRRGLLACAIALTSVATLAIPGSAHHSTAMFAWGTETRLQSMTVDRWEWTNPHTFLYAHDANGTRYAFEGMSPNHLVRYGWSRRSLQPGQVINLTYYALRDGRNGGFNVTVTFANGNSLNQFGERGTQQR